MNQLSFRVRVIHESSIVGYTGVLLCSYMYTRSEVIVATLLHFLFFIRNVPFRPCGIYGVHITAIPNAKRICAANVWVIFIILIVIVISLENIKTGKMT